MFVYLICICVECVCLCAISVLIFDKCTITVENCTITTDKCTNTADKYTMTAIQCTLLYFYIKFHSIMITLYIFYGYNVWREISETVGIESLTTN